jgi:hypothetical protein
VSRFSRTLSFCSPVWGSCVELEIRLGGRLGMVAECGVHFGFRMCSV